MNISIVSNVANDSTQVYDSFESIYQQYETNNSVYTDTVSQSLKSIWSALTNCGRMIKTMQQNSENLDINFTSPNETADSLLYFKDLKIKFKEYGTYQLLFSVDGIEAQLSDIIIIEEGMDQTYVTKIDVFTF